MSERVVPIEQSTGIPLVIAPRFDMPRRLQSAQGEADWHHAVFPKKRPGLQTKSGKAIRSSRVQFVNYDEHRSYHYYFDEYMTEKWELPKTSIERFGMTVLMAAGYIPENAIRCRKHGPEYVALTERRRELLWSRGQVRLESAVNVYDFLQEIIIHQPLEISEQKVDEFLFSKDEQARLRVGNELITAAAESATDVVRPHYVAAYVGKLLMPTLPPDPKDFILESPLMLGTEKRQRKTRTKLRSVIAESLGIDLGEIAA
jgi:hypothetical protein